MSYMEHRPITNRDEYVIEATLEAVVEHLKHTEPKRTLTARQLIRTGMMEMQYG